MKRHRGVALITALLVVALVTATAVAMASRQQLDIRRTANVLQRDQAYVYALGAEVMGREVLGKDDAKIDDKEEDWAQSAISIPFQGGLLSGALEDLQGRFNINNLVKNGVRSPWDVERFKNLLKLIKENSEDREIWKDAEPGDLANAVTDWVDQDNEPLSGGAEDNDYLQGPRPYRAANAPMASISELLLVRGFTGPIYQQVVPWVSALPVRTKINVNTAKEYVLLALDAATPPCMVIKKLGRVDLLPDAAPSADGTKAKGTVFNSAEDFKQSEGMHGCFLVGIKEKTNNNTTPAPPLGAATPGVDKIDAAEVLSVNSSFFQVNAYAEVGPEDHRVKVKLYSVLQRSDGKIATLSRAQGFE